MVRCRLIAAERGINVYPHDGRGSHLGSLAARWRELPVPVIGRIYDGRLWLDLRCLEDEQRFGDVVEMIIATAGHVDHGKTTLLQAITGVNADRLPEEKARHDHRSRLCLLAAAGWSRAGFIDVPGHESFFPTCWRALVVSITRCWWWRAMTV